MAPKNKKRKLSKKSSGDREERMEERRRERNQAFKEEEIHIQTIFSVTENYAEKKKEF